MPVRCEHWTDDNGCALGLFGGRPHVGVCRTHCRHCDGSSLGEMPAIRKRPCPFAVRACCGEPQTCSANGGAACPDPLRQQCPFRLMQHAPRPTAPA